MVHPALQRHRSQREHLHPHGDGRQLPFGVSPSRGGTSRLHLDPHRDGIHLADHGKPCCRGRNDLSHLERGRRLVDGDHGHCSGRLSRRGPIPSRSPRPTAGVLASRRVHDIQGGEANPVTNLIVPKPDRQRHLPPSSTSSTATPANLHAGAAASPDVATDAQGKGKGRL